ncbi:MAG TPA: hypothetical protein VKR06_45420 [Ktedonosporobacter sp.]|nr:hypothetical protein [Ktedonosporobacter sp.]
MNKFNYLGTRTMQMIIVLVIVVVLALLSEMAPNLGNLIGAIASVIFLFICIGCVLLYLARSQGFPLPTLFQITTDASAEKKAQMNTQLLLVSTASMVTSLILLWISRM